MLNVSDSLVLHRIPHIGEFELSQSLVLERFLNCKECYKAEQLVPVRRSLSNILLSKHSKEEINGKNMAPASQYNEHGLEYYAGSSRPTPTDQGVHEKEPD